MQTSAGSLDLDICPVTDAVLAQLLNTSPGSTMSLGATIPEAARAALAVYCYRRAHMRSLGLALALMCHRQSLIAEAGYAGEQIYLQALAADAAPDGVGVQSSNAKRAVSLHII